MSRLYSGFLKVLLIFRKYYFLAVAATAKQGKAMTPDWLSHERKPRIEAKKKKLTGASVASC